MTLKLRLINQTLILSMKTKLYWFTVGIILMLFPTTFTGQEIPKLVFLFEEHWPLDFSCNLMDTKGNNFGEIGPSIKNEFVEIEFEEGFISKENIREVSLLDGRKLRIPGGSIIACPMVNRIYSLGWPKPGSTTIDEQLPRKIFIYDLNGNLIKAMSSAIFPSKISRYKITPNGEFIIWGVEFKKEEKHLVFVKYDKDGKLKGKQSLGEAPLVPKLDLEMTENGKYLVLTCANKYQGLSKTQREVLGTKIPEKEEIKNDTKIYVIDENGGLFHKFLDERFLKEIFRITDDLFLIYYWDKLELYSISLQQTLLVSNYSSLKQSGFLKFPILLKQELPSFYLFFQHKILYCEVDPITLEFNVKQEVSIDEISPEEIVGGHLIEESSLSLKSSVKRKALVFKIVN